MNKSSFGQGKVRASGGISQLNQQNLGGLNAATGGLGGLGARRSMGGIIGSDAGSVYRGVHEEDDISHYMGQSEFGAPTEVGV